MCFWVVRLWMGERLLVWEPTHVVILTASGSLERDESVAWQSMGAHPATTTGTARHNRQHHITYSVGVRQTGIGGERWSRGRPPGCQSRGRWFNPTYRRYEPFFVHPTCACVFGRDNTRRWSLLFGVYARRSKRSHTGDKCVTCSGLTNSRGQLLR